MHPKTFAMAAIFGLTALPALAQTHSAMHHHATDANGALIHDEINMPGLIGENTTDDEVDALKELFINHQGITRTVENLPNGIRTVTEAEDEVLRDAIVNHVASMINRVEDGFDPRIPIQSPTLDLLFAKPELITTEIEFTETGVIVVQTSDDAAMVEALQTHAGEVSDLAARGMVAVHETMMKAHHGTK